MRWLVSIPVLLAGLFVCLLALGSELHLQEHRRLMESGAQAEGTITEQLGARKSNAKFYSYRFRAADREWTASRRDIPYSARELPIGSKVPVRYDPADPARSVTPAELQELEGWGNRFLFPVIGVALVAWAVTLMRARRIR